MLTIHHLHTSQSERIVWLCEELGVPYELALHDRHPVTILAPPELAQIHPLGAAPVITDGELVLAESGAIVEYIIAKHGGGRLALTATHPDFANYLYWFHYANANLQAQMGRNMVLRRLDLAPDNAVLVGIQGRLQRALNWINSRFETADYLAGAEFTAADIMMVFSLTTMRVFMPVDLAPYAHIRTYLARIGARPAYQRAMQKGDPDMTLLLT